MLRYWNALPRLVRQPFSSPTHSSMETRFLQPFVTFKLLVFPLFLSLLFTANGQAQSTTVKPPFHPTFYAPDAVLATKQVRKMRVIYKQNIRWSLRNRGWRAVHQFDTLGRTISIREKEGMRRQIHRDSTLIAKILAPVVPWHVTRRTVKFVYKDGHLQELFSYRRFRYKRSYNQNHSNYRYREDTLAQIEHSDKNRYKNSYRDNDEWDEDEPTPKWETYTRKTRTDYRYQNQVIQEIWLEEDSGRFIAIDTTTYRTDAQYQVLHYKRNGDDSKSISYDSTSFHYTEIDSSTYDKNRALVWIYECRCDSSWRLQHCDIRYLNNGRLDSEIDQWVFYNKGMLPKKVVYNSGKKTDSKIRLRYRYFRKEVD